MNPLLFLDTAVLLPIPALVAQLDVHPASDQMITGSIPTGSGNIVSWRLVMKYSQLSFFHLRWFKKGSCQFLVKECVQVLVNCLED